MDYAEKMNRCHLYVEALEEEKRKIQVFQRELPLCLELVTQAIEACKKELSGTTTEYNMQGQTQSECSEEEQTSSEGPVAVLEQFMPLKRSCSFDHDDDDDDDNNNNKNKNTSDKKKSEWLRSVQLWNQSPDPPPKEDAPRKTVVMEVKRNGGAFQPFQKGKSIGKVNNNSSVPSAETSSTGGNSGNSQKEEKEGQNQRKQRRCWSPELHRRFLHSLQQLGGSHAATPKQIRELMKVDGLTNDEVKSHLQKYRLHTRRPSQTAHNNGNPQAPQFVVVGGIWVPPPEYAAVATTTASGEAASVAAPNGIYAPVATVPQASPSLAQRPQKAQSEHLHSEERSSHNAGGVHSNSPATSSCTHTSTASPVK